MTNRNARRRARRKFWDECYEILFERDFQCTPFGGCPTGDDRSWCKYCRKAFETHLISPSKGCPCLVYRNIVHLTEEEVVNKMRQLYKKNRPRGF
jgi:hypothetical protein